MRSFVLITLLVTAVSSSTEQCEAYLKKTQDCYQDVMHKAGLSATDDRFKTKHLVCCYTHALLDCMEAAEAETSCQLDLREEASNDHLIKYMRLRCDKYNECNGGRRLSFFDFLTLVATLLSIHVLLL